MYQYPYFVNTISPFHSPPTNTTFGNLFRYPNQNKLRLNQLTRYKLINVFRQLFIIIVIIDLPIISPIVRSLNLIELQFSSPAHP